MFILSDVSQFVHVKMFDAITEGFENLGLPFQEVGAREVHRRSVVGVQGAIARQQFKESEQFLHQFALRQRSELDTLSFLQQWSAREERQTARTHEHRLQLVENLGRVDGMLVTMLTTCHTVEERHPSYFWLRLGIAQASLALLSART